MEFNLIAAATEARFRAASSARLVNLYPEPISDGVVALYGTPGLSLFASVGAGPIRGMMNVGGSLYVVSGSQVYSVASTGISTLLGSIVTASGMVSMTTDGNDIQIVDGTANGWLVNVSTGALTAITDGDFPGGVTNAFLDGFVLFNEPGTGKLWATEGYNAGSIDPLSFATAEGLPDDLVAITVDHREVWLFGEQSTEVWYNAGTAGFPFARINGAFLEHGCAAAFSVAKIDNTVFWLGQDDKGAGVVWRADGYTPRRISTHDVETAIAGYASVSDAVAWTYQQDGHAFYVLSFGTETWCYDASTDKWHQRAAFVNGEYARHRANTHAMLGRQHIVGDYENGNLYVLDPETYTDNGAVLAREFVSPHVRSGKRVGYAEVELRMETGVGLQSGQGSDPQVMLATSDDAGRTWGSWRTTSFGAVGQYLARAVFRRLGSGFGKTFKVRVTDPVPVAFISARVEFGE